MIYEHIRENPTKMNIMKLILPALLSFQLTACVPTKYDKNGKPCPPITYGIPECTDPPQTPEPSLTPKPTQTKTGIRN